MSITTAMNTQSADTMAPTLHHVLCPGASRDDAQTHRMAYWEWGRAEHPHWVICVHGLSRQGRDFDALARQLSKTHWVICPDIVGRGESDWLAEPGAYQLPSYVTDVGVLLRALRERRLAALGSAAPAAAPDLQWVGTSMGGLFGLGLGSLLRLLSLLRGHGHRGTLQEVVNLQLVAQPPHPFFDQRHQRQSLGMHQTGQLRANLLEVLNLKSLVRPA